jgi:hypothetical protein
VEGGGSGVGGSSSDGAAALAALIEAVANATNKRLLQLLMETHRSVCVRVIR